MCSCHDSLLSIVNPRHLDDCFYSIVLLPSVKGGKGMKLCSFLWRNRKDKIKRAVIYQPLKEGGLTFLNFETMVKCLPLAWINKFLTNSNDSWKAIPDYYFSSYGGLQFLLRCNYNVNYVTKDLPSFYRELLQYFEEFKMPLNRFRIVNFYLRK